MQRYSLSFIFSITIFFNKFGYTAGYIDGNTCKCILVYKQVPIYNELINHYAVKSEQTKAVCISLCSRNTKRKAISEQLETNSNIAECYCF